MNYYRRYVGDYLRKTARLSMIEHGAYNLLLDYYYAEESPIPLDTDEACRMVRAIRPDERKAIEKVLALYFTKQDDGFHQGRVDSEIAVAQSTIAKQRVSGAESAAKRWPEDRLQGKFDDELPDEYTDGYTDELTDESTNAATHASPIQPPTTNLNTTTNPQNQPKSKPLAASEKISLSAGFEWEGITDERKTLWAKAYPAVDLDSELAAAAVWAMENPKNAKSNWGRFLTAWLKRSQDRAPAKGGGKVPAVQTRILCEFRGDPWNPSTPECGMPNVKKGAIYGGRALCPHHERELSEASERKTEMPDSVRSALKSLVGRVSTPTGKAGWWESRRGVIAKGLELGEEPVEDEPFPEFKGRVFRAAGEGPWSAAA